MQQHIQLPAFYGPSTRSMMSQQGKRGGGDAPGSAPVSRDETTTTLPDGRTLQMVPSTHERTSER